MEMFNIWLNIILFRINHDFIQAAAMEMVNSWLNIIFFRIKRDFSFDDAVSNKYGCTVRAFDPRYVRLHYNMTLPIVKCTINIIG